MPRPHGGYIAGSVGFSAAASRGAWSARDVTYRRQQGAWRVTAPTEIANLYLWLDGSDSGTLFDATTGGSAVAADGAIARWEDKSGNGRHVTQSTSNNRPVRKTAVQNGRDIVRFDGSNDSFVNTSAQFANAPFSAFLVCSRTSLSSANCALIAEYNSTTAAYLALALNQGTSGTFPSAVSIFRVAQAALPSYLFTGAGTARVLSYFSAGVSSGSVTVGVRMDGTPGGAPATSGLLTNASINIGAAQNGTADFFNGDIAEILLYSRQLNASEIVTVETYLSTKWGVTI